MAWVIDPRRLPASMLLDTGVVMRAFGGQTTDPRAPYCVALVDAALANGVRVLIAAPTLGELLRGGPTKAIPRTQGLEIVAFDAAAARVLGSQFPMETLRPLVTATGLALTYLKYDALIVACAVRHQAAFFVCLDEGQKRLAAHVGLAARTPEEFAQPALF